jgi:hypothetical protein
MGILEGLGFARASDWPFSWGNHLLPGSLVLSMKFTWWLHIGKMTRDLLINMPSEIQDFVLGGKKQTEGILFSPTDFPHMDTCSQGTSTARL